jgi:predicted PurR-regulated permease PerM
LLILIAPTLLLGETLAGGVRALAAGVSEGRIAIPAPPEGVRDWPLVGNTIYAQWSTAARDLQSVLEPLQPQLVGAATWLLRAAAGAGFAFLLTVLAIVVAGVLLANDSGGGRAAEAIGRRLAGERGREFTQLAGATVRSVAQGILGVALIQATLAGLGFLAVGIPAAGLVALVGMLCCVIQIGLLPVTLPAVIWVFSTEETVVAVLFTIWTVVVSLLDNVLKPILLGRGVQVPMLVIFLGSLGGFLASGIIGLFVGSVVLVLGYTLFRAWLEDAPPALLEARGDVAASLD